MKIIRNTQCPRFVQLAEIPNGDVFEFKDPIHQKHKRDDLFIRVSVSSAYRPEGLRYCNSIACVNLSTGALAYANGTTPVLPVGADVCAD